MARRRWTLNVQELTQKIDEYATQGDYWDLVWEAGIIYCVIYDGHSPISRPRKKTSWPVQTTTEAESQQVITEITDKIEKERVDRCYR